MAKSAPGILGCFRPTKLWLRTQRQLWCGRSQGRWGPRLSLAVAQLCGFRQVLRKGGKETSICLSECSALSQVSLSLQISEEGNVPVSHGRNLRIHEGN